MRKTLLYLLPAAVLLLGACLFFCKNDGEKQSYTVGVISLTHVDQKTFEGFKKEMERYGFTEGANIRYLNDGPARSIKNLDAMIEKQLKAGVDLLFVSSTPATLAVQHATFNTAVPVVFCPVNDPVASGIVASLEYPGGTVTGVKLPLGEKERFDWLLALSPGIKTVLIPYTPGDKSSEFSRAEAFIAAQAKEVGLIEEPVTDKAGLLALLERRKKEIGAIFLPRDSSMESHIETLVAFADENRLPLAAPGCQQVEQGALFAYGFIHSEMGKQAAGIVFRIFNGTPPASIPVESARNYLIINLDTAKKIGLKIPEALLAGADRLIGGGEESRRKTE